MGHTITTGTLSSQGHSRTPVSTGVKKEMGGRVRSDTKCWRGSKERQLPTRERGTFKKVTLRLDEKKASEEMRLGRDSQTDLKTPFVHIPKTLVSKSIGTPVPQQMEFEIIPGFISIAPLMGFSVFGQNYGMLELRAQSFRLLFPLVRLILKQSNLA